MLTGDNKDVARSIGAQAGIAHVISDVLPGDKAGMVKQLQAQGKKVLMVGDGINDAPALVTADVGMAIGAGTDIAMESAEVVLMSGSLAGVADAVRLSKATILNIKQNLPDTTIIFVTHRLAAVEFATEQINLQRTSNK
jgi:Cu+-exporting ATPase